MLKYTYNRLLQLIPMLFVVSVLAFALSNASSGDVAEITLRTRGIQVTPEAIASARTEMGLDDPLPVQYFKWLKKAVVLDFGTSFQTKKPVSEEIGRRFPATLELALMATLLSLVYTLPIALLSARYKDSFLDHGVRILCAGGVVIPDFWLGLMLLYFFGVFLNVVPVISGSEFKNIFLPAFTLSVSYGATYIRILRSNLIEVRFSAFIKAARARGLSEGAALLKHGLKNAVLPLMTLLGLNFGRLLGGSIACETIFSWNGIGKFAIESIRLKDVPVIQAYLLVVAFTYIIINLLLDLCYMFIDPKIKLGKETS
ncbi:MAG: ABC transporter permease [Deltaproteobacteria bacterium]|jgi:peptide/nickel transport system permease protein|nr:ABC transporter permease [Deltaproteobacteria bacterium]